MTAAYVSVLRTLLIGVLSTLRRQSHSTEYNSDTQKETGKITISSSCLHYTRSSKRGFIIIISRPVSERYFSGDTPNCVGCWHKTCHKKQNECHLAATQKSCSQVTPSNYEHRLWKNVTDEWLFKCKKSLVSYIDFTSLQNIYSFNVDLVLTKTSRGTDISFELSSRNYSWILIISQFILADPNSYTIFRLR